MGAKLVYFSADGQSVSQDLKPEGAILGRAPMNHVVLSDPTVSSRHARVFFQGGAWYAQDMGSINGTTVNDQPIGKDPTPLRHMAVIRCGGSSVHFMLSATPEQQTINPAGGPSAPAVQEVLLAAREELARLKEALAREKRGAADLGKERDRLEERLRAADKEFEELKKGTAELRFELGKAERDRERLIAERDRLRADEREAREEAGKASATLIERTRDLERLRTELVDKQRAHDDDQRALRTLREQHQALKEQAARARVEPLPPRTAGPPELEKLELANRDLSRARRELEERAREQDSRIAALEAQRSDQEHELRKLRDDRERLEREHKERVVQHNGLRVEHRALTQELEAAKEKDTRQGQKIDKLLAELEKARQDLREAEFKARRGAGQDDRPALDEGALKAVVAQASAEVVLSIQALQECISRALRCHALLEDHDNIQSQRLRDQLESARLHAEHARNQIDALRPLL